jgi:hypothetical protein
VDRLVPLSMGVEGCKGVYYTNNEGNAIKRKLVE